MTTANEMRTAAVCSSVTPGRDTNVPVLGSDAPESQPEYVEYLRRDRAALFGQFGSCLNRRRLDVYERAALTAWREKGVLLTSGYPPQDRTTRGVTFRGLALRRDPSWDHLGPQREVVMALRTANCAIFLMKFGGADLSLWTRNGCSAK